MTDDHLKDIEKVVNRALIPVMDKLNELSGAVNQHTAILNQHTAILNQHTIILNQHSAILNEHSELLKDHSEHILAMHDDLIDVRQRIAVIE